MTKHLIIAKSYLNSFLKRREGAAMAEYGLLLFLIAVVVIAGATALGKAINGVYNTVAGDL
jgi:Flp pilus assembly pilin Flp